MRLVINSQDEKVINVECGGEICESRFPTGVSNPLEHLLGESCYNRRVVMDMGEATFIDSSGICWLMACHKRFLASGGQLILYSIPPMVEQVLRILHLHTILNIRSDRNEALADLTESRGTT